MAAASPRTVLLVVLLNAALAPPASAAPDARAQDLQLGRKLYERAEVHYRGGEVDRALALYRRAYRSAPLPGFLFNIAQCYRRLGQLSKALAYYRAYAAELPDAPNREQVEALITMCRQRLGTQQGAVMMAARPKQASRPPFGQRVSLAVPTPSTATPAVHRSAAAPAAATASPEKSSKRPWIYAGASLSGALAITGTITGAIALASSDDYRQPGLTPGQRGELKQRGETMRVTSTVTFALAGTLAAGTAILYLVDRHARRRARVAVAPVRGGGAVVVARRF